MLTRLAGDHMLVGIKDVIKFIGVSIIACCAVMVCTMFLNFYIDIHSIEGEITTEIMKSFYDAQVSTAKLICFITGGCLLITSVIMLLFYIKHYIDVHKKQLGILKALGYSNIRIARSFWVCGISVFIGTAVGFGMAFILMPTFYALQNEDQYLPEITVHFHPIVLLCFVILPTLFFSVLSVLYAWRKLRKPVLSLLRDNLQAASTGKKRKADKPSKYSFISDLKRDTLKGKKTLAFFIVFASFCFSAMTQMSFSMQDLASKMMGAMILLIGLVLAFTTLYLAITTVINGNIKTIAMMRVFGYSHKECRTALLGGYRPIAYIGFAVGSIYQYALLRIMVDIVFKDIEGVPVYKFDFPVMFVSLAVFILAYELLMYIYSDKIRHISVKEIMVD